MQLNSRICICVVNISIHPFDQAALMACRNLHCNVALQNLQLCRYYWSLDVYIQFKNEEDSLNLSNVFGRLHHCSAGFDQ